MYVCGAVKKQNIIMKQEKMEDKVPGFMKVQFNLQGYFRNMGETKLLPKNVISTNHSRREPESTLLFRCLIPLFRAQPGQER